VKPTDHVLFHQYEYILHLVIACEDCNDKKIQYVHYTTIFTAANSQIYIFKKPRFNGSFIK